MTDHDLATLVRQHAHADEPPFLMSPETAIALGRRTLVRRRARRGFTGVLVAAAAVAALPLVPWGGSAGDDATGIDPATAAALRDYDAQRMPALIDSHVRAALGHGLAGLGAPAFHVSDGQDELAPKDYDRASSMEVTYGGTGDRRVRVVLQHARSEAEGNARKNCAHDLELGYVFSCDVTRSARGDTVRTDVMAVRRLDALPDAAWGVVTREELRTGVPAPGDPGKRPIDPTEVYFVRSVESVHSETFLTRAEEIVRAPDVPAAEQLWKVPVADLETIVTDPELVIPEPAQDERQCRITIEELRRMANRGEQLRNCAGTPALAPAG